MTKNGYFRLINKDKKMWLEAYPPEGDGDALTMDMVAEYLALISFPDYNQVALSAYISEGDFSEPFFLYDGEILPENEKCVITISKSGDKAFGTFFPPSTDGKELDIETIVSDLKFAGVKHGVKKRAINHFLTNRDYCREFILAEATMPIQGKDASIEYFFDLNVTARPKLNEDGSVDFHQLGNIRPIEVGQKLAELTPVDRGTKGISVLGNTIMPKKVRNRVLRFGRNIRISNDKCVLYSEIAGHVSLVDDMVMVSDVYKVPANVDSSTGDIDYNGTVEVAGNVLTGFKIKASGDIVVNGVVEGASLLAGGNIVLKRGMQGMDRGELVADGNITAKFLESCTVKCGGSLKADAILHSTVECIESVDVNGKKGLINGGSVQTYATISASTLGSEMGASTKIEVLPEKDLHLRVKELKQKIQDAKTSLAKMDSVVAGIRKHIEGGNDISEEQKAYLKKGVELKPALSTEIKEMQAECEMLINRIEKNKNACIKVEKEVYPGVKLMIKDVMKIQKDKTARCRFVRDGADIRIKGY